MPTYDYKCYSCGEQFEVFQSMSDEAITNKPNCDSEQCNPQRIISGGTGLIFKGSGFYLTDYKNKSNPTNSDTNDSQSKSKTKDK